MLSFIIILIVLTLLPFLILPLFAYLKKPETRGKRGENSVRTIIGTTIENEQYIINDLTILIEGRTSQIDHIVINPQGVFVIETKNYSGKIYGSENQREWTQVLAYGKVKNKLYNPLKQNAIHIYNVRKIIGNLPIHSLVVFVNNNTNNIDADNVIPLSALKNVLHSGKVVLTTKQMQTAYSLLLSNKTETSTEEHIKNIRKRQWNLEHGMCPRCGGNLVLRNGKYGKFFGCSNYPKCNFTKNV